MEPIGAAQWENGWIKEVLCIRCAERDIEMGAEDWEEIFPEDRLDIYPPDQRCDKCNQTIFFEED